MGHFFSLRYLRRLGLSLLGFALTMAIAIVPGSAPTPAAVPSIAAAVMTLEQTSHGTLAEDAPTPADGLTAATSPTALLAEGRTHYNAGRFVAAIDVWNRAAQSAVQKGQVAQQIMSLNGLSAAYQALNDWSQARQAIERSRALLTQSPQIDPMLWGQTLNTHASLLLSHLGQADRALATWEEAEHYYKQAGDVIGVLGCQINQAEALKHLGFYRRARQQLDGIQQQLISMPNSEVKVAGLRSLGNALQLIGQPRDSYAILAQSLDVTYQLNAPSERSAILLSIGKLAAEIDSSQIALTYFDAAEQAALMPLDQLQARLAQLANYVETGSVESIPAIATQIQQQLETLPPSRTTIYATVNFAHNLGRLPAQHRPVSLTRLSQLLGQAAIAANTLGDQRAEAYVLKQMGQLYRQTKQWAEALTLTQRSLDLAETIHAADITAQSAWQLGQLFKQNRQPRRAIQAYTTAVASLKQLRGDLVAVNQDVRFSYREQVEPVYRELIELLLEDKRQSSLKQARDVLEALQVAELDNFFREACVDLDEDQIDRLDPNATVVHAIMLPDRIATIYSKAGQPLTAHQVRVKQTNIETTLRSFLAALHPSADQDDKLKYAQTLYQWLIRPAEDSHILTPDQTLVFVLDGLLRNVPMAALHDGKQYLIEKYSIALSPGLQIMQTRSLENQNIQALVGGISEARGRFSELPAVVGEVEEISQLIPSFQLLNAQLTRTTLTTRLSERSVNIVHLATHGQFSSEFDDTFFLIWDDVININELSEILRNRETSQGVAIELLTLSACETATSDDRAVLGLAGLAVRSGARSTIATLWPIRDNVAKQLMTAFYRYLTQPGTSKAEALRQAQLDILHSDYFADPFFWSAYVLIGNWL